ncbi:MAG: 3-ketoacyl-CoA thiolase, peroxisomal [Geoglossum simile]|nr:MAG: 3-ketoacyl-CoA thiolase, peroxisomal [Geoglossum simile]
MSTARARLDQVSGHLSSEKRGGRDALLEKRPDDIVITCALRTPFTRGGRGFLKDTPASDLLAGILSALISRSGIDPTLVEDIAVGSVLAPGGGATEFRAAALVAGFPDTTAVRSVNRQCSSGLQAIVDVANQIKAGTIEIGVGAGVESMSTQYGPAAVSEFSSLLSSHPLAKTCVVPMGVLSEKMAQDLSIPRAAQDAFAASSYQKALRAQQLGHFSDEIVPLAVKWEDPKSGEVREVEATNDDGVREGITPESLGKIKPAFAENGSIHAGNASQISDGASAVLLMKRSTAHSLSLPILGTYISSAIVALPPLLMGLGPLHAIPKLLLKHNITIDAIDIFEINEAFASQCIYCVQTLGIPMDKVNPAGGAIAWGHPLGATGARQVGTLFGGLKRMGGRVGVTSMCIGTGMGMAALWVAEY